MSNFTPQSNMQSTSTNIEIPQSVQNIGNNISESVNSFSQSVKSSLDGFSQSTEPGIESSTGFFSSNTIIAKFVFLIFVLIIFLFLLNLGILVIQYFLNPSSSSPFMIEGKQSGSTADKFQQDPKNNDSILIRRSNNQSSGLEFTWSTWLYINDLKSGNTHQHVFHKGVNEFDDSGIARINNAPGLYIVNKNTNESVNTATLKVVMTTTDNSSNSNKDIEIDDIPIKKWVNVIIRMKNTTLDVYINGTVAGRMNLVNVPLQNYYDVFVGQNSGFLGDISNLQYFDHALNIFQITKIINAGPNTDPTAGSKKLLDNYNYLSTSWFTAKL